VSGGGAKPGERRGGRQKGTPNKINSDIKAMILGALSAKGGQKYFEEQADLNPSAFMGLVGKVLPTTLANDPNAPFSITIVSGVDRSTKKGKGG
jgi:hypothetical protein